MSNINLKELSEKLKNNINKVIVGKDEIIDKVIISCFCSGHILLEDIPGTGKTTLAKTLSKSIDCEFKRVQFTPDLLPSDVTGINFYNQKAEEFVFKKGPIFTNILLADEINRATPRTQSSLLECMEERQASIDGTTYPMQSPFLVIATQNPIEIQGTFPLPEAQLDRFFMKLSMGYPSAQSEQDMLTNFINENPLDELKSVAARDEIISAQEQVKTIKVSDAVKGYILRIIDFTRHNDKIRLGVSPRGSLALMRAAQGVAGINGRDFVTPDDVKAICEDVISHRIICKGYNMMQSSAVAKEQIRQILVEVAVPIE